MKRPAKIVEGVEKEAKDVTLGDFAESLLGPAAAAEWPRFLDAPEGGLRARSGRGGRGRPASRSGTCCRRSSRSSSG